MTKKSWAKLFCHFRGEERPEQDSIKIDLLITPQTMFIAFFGLEAPYNLAPGITLGHD